MAAVLWTQAATQEVETDMSTATLHKPVMLQEVSHAGLTIALMTRADQVCDVERYDLLRLLRE